MVIVFTLDNEKYYLSHISVHSSMCFVQGYECYSFADSQQGDGS